MTPSEKALFDSIVHGLRMQDWSRADTEAEALARIDSCRALDRFPYPPEECPWHVGGAFDPNRCRNCGQPLGDQHRKGKEPSL